MSDCFLKVFSVVHFLIGVAISCFWFFELLFEKRIDLALLVVYFLAIGTWSMMQINCFKNK